MPAYDNTAIAAKLDLAADLLELSGADKFRFLSYRKAANALGGWPEQAAVMASEGRLTDIRGVGPKMAANVEQIIARGSFDALDELTGRYPATLAEVMRVPGIGPKRAVLLHDKLGVRTLDDLALALEQDRVAAMGGFGPKTADKIASSLAAHRRHRERIPIGVAVPLADALCRDLVAQIGIDDAVVVGSVRRREDTVGNIDIVVRAGDPETALDAAAQLAAVERVVERVPGALGIELHDGTRVDVRAATPGSFAAARRFFTGSVAHNDLLAERAAAMHVDVGPEAVASSERELYGLLGMDEPAPEIRRGRDEIELAAEHRLPELVTLRDIRGDLQSHSTFTDGRGDLSANRAIAAELGYEYLAATDHAYNLRMVGGLDLDDIKRQWAEIDDLNAEAAEKGLPRIIKGIELNIGPDGSLDYDDEVLAGFELVLASLHSGWDEDVATATARVTRAIEHPLVDVIAHPTGRVIGRRDPIPIDVRAMLEAAGETGTIMEINSYPDRLDLTAEHIRMAREFGVRFSLGTDAHAPDHFRFMPFGVSQARRGLVVESELLNTQPWDVARTWLKRARVLGA